MFALDNPVLVAFFAIALCYFLFYSKSDLPGPSGIFENVQFYRKLIGRKSHEVYMQYARKHDMFRLGRTVVVCDKEAAKQILTSKSFARGSFASEILEGVLNYALFLLPTGELHHRHRKMIQPAFGPGHLRSAAKISVNVMDRDFAGKCDIHKVFSQIAMQIIGLVAFGYDLKAFDDEKDKLWDAIEIITGPLLLKRAFLPRFLWPAFGVSGVSNSIVKAKETLEQVLTDLTIAKEEAIKSSQIDRNDWGLDVLQRLLMGNKDGRLSNEEIYGELLGFFLAGHETTANTLTFAVLELCRNPDVMAKLYEEVRNIDFEKDNLLESISNLKHLDNVMRETQRLHSIVGSVPRAAQEDVVVMGKPFPKGTVFSVYFRAIHMSNKYYDNPEKFDPDRWNSPQTNGAWMPFSDGIHNCIGQKLAVIEFKIVLARMIQKYEIQLIPEQKIEFFTTITHGLKNGLQVLLTKRKQ